MNCLLCLSENTETFYQRQDKRWGLRVYRHCSNCRLVFLEPLYRLSREVEKERYSLHENDPHDQGYIEFLRKLADPLGLKLKAGQVGLDFGCGTGPCLAGILEQKGVTVKNYDPFFYPQEELLDDQYDFVASTEVVEHFYNPRKEFQLFQKLLKKGGFLGIMTGFHNFEKPFESWWYHREETHVCFYHPDTFRWIADWLNWRMEIPAENVVLFQKV